MRVDRPTRLCIVIAADGGEAVSERLAAALAAGDVASVVIAPGRSRALEAATARPLIDVAQSHGAAALLVGDARLARTLKADGVHLPACDHPAEVYAEARGMLGQRAIVGADAGRSRHDAMALGEAGADYVAFGIPAVVKDRDKARARRLDLIGWWAEIFEVPCVAFDVGTPEEAAELSLVGADFIAVELPVGGTIGTVRDLVVSFADAVGAAQPAR